MAVIVKRRGKKEKFNEDKIYKSVYSACIDCDLNEEDSEKIARTMVEEVKNFLKERESVNSTEIFGFIIQKLAREHEAVAFMFETHREMALSPT